MKKYKHSAAQRAYWAAIKQQKRAFKHRPDVAKEDVQEVIVKVRVRIVVE